jgi:hypothetical protein
MTTELESDNARLRSKLEQARQALAEADAAWSSFFEFCGNFLLGRRLNLLMLVCIFPQEMHIFVPRGKTALDASCFFLTAEYSYYAEGGWDFKVEVP